MPNISDVEKLRPELLDISDAEFERRMTEMEMARIERQRKKEIAEKESTAAEINKHVDTALEAIKWLKANRHLPDRIVDAFSRNETFAPSQFLKHVTPESLLPREFRAKPTRKRRTKAEIEAMKAAGTYKPRRRG